MFPTRDWIERYLELLNHDEELKLYSKHFNLLYALESDSYKYLICAKNGIFKLCDGDSVSPEVTLRTSGKHWMNFVSPNLIPTYTDLFGASAHGNLEIDGNIQSIWSNIRSLWRTVEMMRKVGEAQ